MKNNSYIENYVYLVFPEKTYDLAILTGTKSLDSDNDNVDVEVRFKDGKLYTATFFTLQNIKSLFEKNKRTGECFSGLYFSCNDMVIVEKLTVEVIAEVVKKLVQENTLQHEFVLQDGN
jgi:hypothetical protein